MDVSPHTTFAKFHILFGAAFESTTRHDEFLLALFRLQTSDRSVPFGTSSDVPSNFDINPIDLASPLRYCYVVQNLSLAVQNFAVPVSRRYNFYDNSHIWHHNISEHPHNHVIPI